MRLSNYSYLGLICLFFGGCFAPALQGDMDVLDRKIRRQNKEMKIVRQQQAELGGAARHVAGSTPTAHRDC